MAGLPRKRGRSSAAAVQSIPASKKREIEEDEEILSDEVGSELGDDVSFDGSHVPDSPESDHGDETVEEKRLRLARLYLRHAGISEDAADPEDEEYGSDQAAENDAANKHLREEALKLTGKSTTHVADKLSAALENVTIRRCRGHALPPTCIALAADDEATAISGGKDSRIIIWDVETGQKKLMFKPVVTAASKKKPALADAHIGNILTVAITDDANLAVSGGEDQLIRVWDLRAGKPVDSMRGHRGPVHGLSFRAGSRQLFSASRDRTVKIWDMSEMAYVETLFGHGAEVNGISSLAMERALSCGRDGTMRLYKVIEGSQLVFRSSLTMSIDAAAMVNENRFVSGGDDGTICLWQSNKKKPTSVIQNAHGSSRGCESWISAVAAFANSDLTMSGGGDGVLRFWKCENVPKLYAAGSLDLGPGFINGIAVGGQRRIIATAVGSEHRLGRWTRIRGVRNTVQFVALPQTL